LVANWWLSSKFQSPNIFFTGHGDQNGRSLECCFIDWCLLIDTVQSFWRNGCIWYPVNSVEWHSVASDFLTKALQIQWIFFWNSTVHNLSIDIKFVIVHFKTTCVQIFFQRTPTKVYLKTLFLNCLPVKIRQILNFVPRVENSISLIFLW